MSNDSFMDILVKLNTQAVGRDKLIRLLQYGSKMLAWMMDQARVNKDFIIKFQNLEFSLSTGRKLLRLGKFIDMLHGALKTIHLPDVAVRVTLTLARISQALFLLTDHIIWIGRMGLFNVNKAKWTQRSNKFWLLSIIFQLLRDLHELKLAMEGELNIMKKKRPYSDARPTSLTCAIMQPTIRCMRNHKDVVVDVVKNGCDVWIPMTSLGYVKFSPGLVGLLGVVSSVAGIVSLVSPAMKLQPS